MQVNAALKAFLITGEHESVALSYAAVINHANRKDDANSLKDPEIISSLLHRDCPVTLATDGITYQCILLYRKMIMKLAVLWLSVLL